MLVESIICPPTSSYPLHIAAKRYSAHYVSGVTGQQCSGCDNELTLIFLHSTSFPKEIWEPTIEYLLQGENRWRTRIREAYAIDCPNHGVAAVLNDGLLGDTAGTMVPNYPALAVAFVAQLLITALIFLQPGRKCLPSARCSFYLAAPRTTRQSTFRNGISLGLVILSVVYRRNTLFSSCSPPFTTADLVIGC